MKCADCGAPSRHMTPAALRKGSKVREPGEPLCAGCSSRRVLMVREVDQIPADLRLIQAARMPHGERRTA